ncbi:hypothetical protein DL93DRAFT_2171455 [Clavulina sp. PMI_390]|nr:hypothetical protein DL93DRAFT_2171455 [Clavulina sp. PMI_390]
MSAPSSPASSSASFDFVSGGVTPAKKDFPARPQVPQFFYYSLYQDGAPIACYQRLGSSVDERSDRMGQLLIDDLPPPRNICESEENTSRLNVVSDAPGCHPAIPVHAIIIDGADRATFKKPALAALSPHRPLSSQALPPFSKTVVHKGALWDVTNMGLPNPK